MMQHSASFINEKHPQHVSSQIRQIKVTYIFNHPDQSLFSLTVVKTIIRTIQEFLSSHHAHQTKGKPSRSICVTACNTHTSNTLISSLLLR